MGTPDRGPWIQTYSGRAVHLLDPSPDEICLEDIAHALALKARFSGRTKWYYSVAQHCVLGADYILRRLPQSCCFALSFLLHALGEVYLPDVASPLKPSLTVAGLDACRWDDLEMVHARAALTALCLSPGLDEHIQSPKLILVDRAMLMTEANRLLPGGCLPDWGYAGIKPASVQINRWSPEVAESQWLEMYRWLHLQVC